MSSMRDQLNDWLKEIDISDKIVLDVGCGGENKWAMNHTKGKPSEYMTLDIDGECKPDIICDLNDCYNWGHGTRTPEIINYKDGKDKELWSKFDVIFCLEVLEHCWNPVQAIDNLFSLLKESGVCYISVPFINPHHDKWDYLRFTGEWFEKVLKDIGFKEVIVKERVAMKGKDLLKSFFNIEGLRVSKIRPEYKKYTYPIGYLIKTIK